MSSITLPSKCDRQAAELLYVDLAEAAASNAIDTPIVLDASKVEQMSHAALQLLVSAARTGAGIDIQSPSHAFLKASELTQLNHILMEASAS